MKSTPFSVISAQAVPHSISRGLVALLVTLIGVYRNTLGQVLPSSCRYTPTCSQYAIDALRKYGVVSGLVRAGRRLLRCHPYSRRSGYDPA